MKSGYQAYCLHLHLSLLNLWALASYLGCVPLPFSHSSLPPTYLLSVNLKKCHLTLVPPPDITYFCVFFFLCQRVWGIVCFYGLQLLLKSSKSVFEFHTLMDQHSRSLQCLILANPRFFLHPESPRDSIAFNILNYKTICNTTVLSYNSHNNIL